MMSGKIAERRSTLSKDDNSNSVLRIFSYLPNPRVWKSLITAGLCGVEIELLGDKPSNLPHWLWDFDARPLSESDKADSPYARQSRRGFSGELYKTDQFLQEHPFGTVPAGFSPSGLGIFESNSILRAVARAGSSNLNLYGKDDYHASRVDSFLDANLVFSREAQVYLLGMNELTLETYNRMQAAYEFYLSGIENCLQQGDGYLVGGELSIADISYVCDFAQFLREGHNVESLHNQGLDLISKNGPEEYPLAYEHMLELSSTEAFSSVMGTYLNWYRKKLGLD